MSIDSWEKRYKKWDNFNDDDSDDNANKSTTQFDHCGDENIDFQDNIFLEESQIDRYRRLDPHEREIWQIVVRKLRVWTAASIGAEEGVDAIPCRPYCILINNLYPLGQVISKKICDPPEQFPRHTAIFEASLQVMENPPENVPQHRPGKIVFSHREFVGQLRKSYAALDIECSFLTESDGIDEYIKEYSNLMVRKGFANIGENSEKAGLLSRKENSIDLIRRVFSTVSKLSEKQPWRYLSERQAIHLKMTSESNTDNQSAFAVVLGSCDEGLRGIGVFFSRTDLERRLIPKGEKPVSFSDPSLRRCAYCDKMSQDPSAELRRCSRCKSTFYCNSECQKMHWRDHKTYCSTSMDSAGQWARKEVSMFLGSISTMSFDDLDMIDKYNLDVCAEEDFGYPTIISFVNGNPSVPNPNELLWLERAAHSFVYLFEHSPLFMKDSLQVVLGFDHDPLSIELKIPSSVTSSKVTATWTLQNATVITESEAHKLKAMLQKEKISNGETSDSNSATPLGTVESPMEELSTQESTSKGSSGGCFLM